MRPVTEDDTGIKILYDGSSSDKDADPALFVEYDLTTFPQRVSPTELTVSSIVAIHGIGAHPDDTWCKKLNSDGSEERHVNWLRDTHMLPTVVPQTRIMRYGYESQWFGEESISLKASTVAQRLLRSLNRARKVNYIYPILDFPCAHPALGVSFPAFDIYRALFRWIGDP